MKIIFLISIYFFTFLSSVFAYSGDYSCSKWKLVIPLSKSDPFKSFYTDLRGINFLAKKNKNGYEITDQHKDKVKLTFIGKFNNTGVSLYSSFNDKYSTVGIYSISNRKDKTIEIKNFAVNTKYTYSSKCYRSNSNDELEEYKNFCAEIGFKPGTEKFGQCVMKAMEKG